MWISWASWLFLISLIISPWPLRARKIKGVPGRAVQWLLGDPVKGGRAEKQSYVMGKMRFRDYPDFNVLVSP